MKATWSIVLSIYLNASAVVPARAECVQISVAEFKRLSTVVFEGTVTRLEARDHNQLMATMDVHRVWKGKPGQQIAVYFIRGFDGPNMERGKRYVVFMRPLSETMRKAHELPEDTRDRNWVPACGGANTPNESLLKELGRSQAPGRR